MDADVKSRIERKVEMNTKKGNKEHQIISGYLETAMAKKSENALLESKI